MKKIVQKEVQICDQCGKETYCEKCFKCGVEHCYECRKKFGVKYTHAVYLSGSGDGYYCTDCNNLLLKNGNDPLHTAYYNIFTLINESRGFYNDFKIRADKAEAVIKELHR